ncbi:MAG: fatty acid CoA ligase family protein [Actinomycetota bacterium]|nr:fatty acid CoA ligase family protein [Actinomycetota bacterium]
MTVDLAAALTANARRRPDRPALVLPTGRWHRAGTAGFRVTTYADLDRRSEALAAGLSVAGIGPGTRTAMLVPPGEDFFALVFALLKAAAVPVLVDPGMGLRNVGTCLSEARPGAFVAVPRGHLAARALRWCPEASVRVTTRGRLPGVLSLRAVERRGADPARRLPARKPGDAAVVAFTSGSTGVPKGVELTVGNLLAQVELIRDLYDLRPGEVSLATFPPFALLGPALGLTTVVPRMDPTRPAAVDSRRLVDAVRTYGASVMFGSPALLDTLVRWAGPRGETMPTLRRVVSAGAPVAPALQRCVLDLLPPGAQVHSPYGATEALPVTSIGSDELLALPERPLTGVCVGRPVPGVDVTVVPITDEPLPEVDPRAALPPGEVGEVVVRGPVVTRAYVERPAATARAKTRWDGRLAHRMGDAGYLDEAGRLWFCGRTAHRVTTPHGVMFSVPCEQVFDAHPAVRRSALVGVGPAGQQLPIICVELERGVRASGELTAQLLDLAASTPETKAIGTVVYVRRFPVDVRHNAKIRREELARLAARRLRR